MKRIYKNNDFIVQGKYYLYNNLWGASTGTGNQYLWETAISGSQIAWGTSWNWTGQRESIKSYVAAILGWHWGWKVVNTDLPIQLSLIKNIYTSWKYNLTHKIPGRINVSYDIWLSNNPQQGDQDPTGEIMIWLYNTGNIKPIGSKQFNITIAEIEWELWKGNHPVSSWPVYSFIRTTNTNFQLLNLMDFFNKLFLIGLNNSDYLLSIEAGVEVFIGAGRLDTIFYSVDIE